MPLATNCAHCGVSFKERDLMTITDGKVVHASCFEKFKANALINGYKYIYPFLEEEYISKIMYTSNYVNKEFDKINQFDWIVLLSLNNQEMTINGFKTQEEVENFIKNHYMEKDSDSGIDAVYYQKQLYKYSVDITVSIISP
jgi:hypothetical protein